MEDGVFAVDLFGKEHPVLMDLARRRKENRIAPSSTVWFMKSSFAIEASAIRTDPQPSNAV